MSTKRDIKRIIVNADDFGLTEGINRGVIDALRYGIITRASIMPCATAFDHAVSLVKQNPGLNIGIHLTLVGERPVSSADKIKSLIESDGTFYKNHQAFSVKYFSKKIKLNEIYDEFEAQIKKILNTGIKVNHIDSHQHLHMLPGIFEQSISLAKKFEIKNIRITRQDYSSIGSFRELALVAMNSLSLTKHKKKLSASDICFTNNFWGFKKGGLIKEKDLLDFFDRIKPGITEVMCHPGYSDQEYVHRYSHWGYSPDEELKALTSQNVKNKLKSEKIELIF